MSSSTVSRYRESSSLITSPSKIYDEKENSFTEEYALDVIAKEAELRLQHQRQQNREARQIRSKQLEKSFQDEDDEDEHLSTNPISTSIKSELMKTNSLLLQKFLNGDIDLRSIEHRDLKRLLVELESKYKSLMITNSTLFNEKQALEYQIDTYKDNSDDFYETLNQTKRQFKEKSRKKKDLGLQKQIAIDLEENNNHLKQILMNCQRLIDEHEKQEIEDKVLVNQSLDEKLKKILDEKHEQYEQIIKLKFDLDQQKNQLKIFKEQLPNSIDFNNHHFDELEQQKQLTKEILDLQNRLQKYEADNVSLHQENKRYEAQLIRHKQQSDDAERVEDELKQERRRLQKELRNVRDELENERTRSDVLQRENARLRKKNLLNNPDDDLGISTSHSPLLTNNSDHIQSNSPIEDIV